MSLIWRSHVCCAIYEQLYIPLCGNFILKLELLKKWGLVVGLWSEGGGGAVTTQQSDFNLKALFNHSICNFLHFNVARGIIVRFPDPCYRLTLY